METLKNAYTVGDIAKTLPEKLKYFRTKANLTTQEVGNYLNKTASTVTMWEKGKAIPSIETMLRICNLYKISDINELVENDIVLSNDNFECTRLNRTEQNLIKLWRSAKPHIRAAITTILKECI